MSRKFSPGEDELEHLSEKEFAEYWEIHDASEILETGRQESLEITEVDKYCPACGSTRVRPRVIDLPILSGNVVLKRVKTLHCVECDKSSIEQEVIDEILDTLNGLVGHKDKEKLLHVLEKALISYDVRWTKKENERKVISVYIPTKAGEPNKAQISIKVSDPLYPKLRFLTSEEIRKLLGIEYYEDLKQKAENQRRTLSEYMKIALEEKLRKPSESGQITNRLQEFLRLPVQFGVLPRSKGSAEAVPLTASSRESQKTYYVKSSGEAKEFLGRLIPDIKTGDLNLYTENVAEDLKGRTIQIMTRTKKGETLLSEPIEAGELIITLVKAQGRMPDEVKELIVYVRN